MRRVISWLTEYSYRKAWLVLIAVVLIVGFGAFTFTRVRQELIPDIQFPLLTVIVQAPGSQPDDVVRTVTTPIEQATAGIPGLKSTESTSIAGLSVILLNFEFGTDLDRAETLLKEQLDTAQLPPTATTSVLTFDPASIPIVTLSLQGDLNPAQLATIAQTQVVPALANLDGVASVEVVGGALTEILVTLDRQQMLDAGVSYDQVAAALRANNVILPSGQLQTGDTTLPIQTVAVLSSVDTIRQVGIQTPAGSTVSLGSIAQVTEAPAAATGVSRTDGQPSVSIRVVKEQDANTVEVAHAVIDEAEAIQPTLPAGVSLTVAEDLS
ncbi:MAG: efflux RND transporter permease subunit, partial [Dehalococcoidia bacterium]